MELNRLEEGEDLSNDKKRLRIWHKEIKNTDNKRLDELKIKFIKEYGNDSDSGYIFKCDMKMIDIIFEWLKLQD